MKPFVLSKILLPAVLLLQSLVSASLLAQPKAPEGAVATRPPGALMQAPDQFFEKDGTTIRYREIGSGPPVILLHGFLLYLEVWDTAATALATEHRVIAMDFRGMGGSSKFSDSEDFGEQLGLDVIRLMDHLGIEQAHVVGHSLGALYAGWLAAQHGDRLLSATLVAGPFNDSSQAQEQVMLDSLKQGGGIEDFVQYASPNPLPAEVLTTISQFYLSYNDRASMIGILETLGTVRKLSASPVPSVPALILCGTADPLLQTARDLSLWWREASYVELPGIDHMSIIEHADAINAIRERLR